jgi:hypothetical protein
MTWHFRFTIRDLLWLTLIVGLATGWWLEHRYYADHPFWRIPTAGRQKIEAELYKAYGGRPPAPQS